MPNVQSIISSHNKAVLDKSKQEPNTPECNCREKNCCPLKGMCQSKSIVYQATVKNTTTSEEQTYVGLTETSFKTRYHNHTSSFRNKNKDREKYQTEKNT